MADWLSNANEALHIKLVRAARDEAGLTEDERALVEEFHPTFTYPIFGDKETIYGYSDLKISLSLASGSLSMYLNIASSAKLPSKTADDIEGTLYKFIPPDYSKSTEAFQATVEKDAALFKPLGEKIYTYTRRAAGRGKGKNKDTSPVSEDDPDAVIYEVYHSTWDTPGFREYHRRMQLFILLYIEGGSYIQEDEDKWEYERRRNSSPNDPDGSSFTYHFAGYSSLYPFWCWPDKVRLRLSQFVILPPYQHAGHGSALYSAIYQLALRRDDVVELTVEDPSEAFEDLRDRNDLKMLLSHDTFMREGGGPGPNADSPSGKFGPPVDKRQFQRLVEMLILRELDASSKQAQKAFRLQASRRVKERLYRFNYEILSQLEKDERLEKLEETFQNVQEDYQRILPTVK